MKATQNILRVLVLSSFAGCNGTAVQKDFLTVDFQKNHTLRYKFVSNKDIDVRWNPTQSSSKSSKKKVDRYSESMEMVVAYTATESDPYGLTTIQATCESIKVKRSSSTHRRVTQNDVVENLLGKTFTFTVSPSGKIDDYSQLNKLIREIGEKAFRKDTRRGKIKGQDMIGDFIASQWFLWDSISSIKKPADGVVVGQTWDSKLSIPTPMVIQKVREVTYSLDQIRRTKKGRLAVIRSSYKPAKSVPRNWPMPYPNGTFQMSGTFGFLRGYKVLDLHGGGQELFNIDKGRTEQYNQQYQVKFAASFPFALGVTTHISIKQNLTMQLLE